MALVGGGLNSWETALYLANEGKKVYIINRRDHLTYHEKIMMPMFDTVPIMMRDYALYERPIEVFNDLGCTEILDNGVRCQFKDSTINLTGPRALSSRLPRVRP